MPIKANTCGVALLLENSLISNCAMEKLCCKEQLYSFAGKHHTVQQQDIFYITTL